MANGPLTVDQDNRANESIKSKILFLIMDDEISEPNLTNLSVPINLKFFFHLLKTKFIILLLSLSAG